MHFFRTFYKPLRNNRSRIKTTNMKYIISLFVMSALVAMSFAPSKDINFSEFLPVAISQSQDGFKQLKTSKGDWNIQQRVLDFDRCEGKYDPEIGLNFVQLTRVLEDEGSADQFAARFTGYVGRLTEGTNYEIKTKAAPTSGKTNFVHSYKSTDSKEKDEHPVIEVSVGTEGDKYTMMVKIFEPNKNKKALKKR
jgi:hypothetical protein